MLRTRLIAGTVLAAAMGGVLLGDAHLAPHYPCLLGCVLLVGVLGARELRLLLPEEVRPPALLCVAGVVLVLAANWVHLLVPIDPWRPPLYAVAVLVIAALLHEMARFRGPGYAVSRVAHATLAFAYLGLLPSFFVQLRWLPEVSGLALTLAVFVPKVGDIGAYFTGRFLGKHQFSPVLSPKKTWEGFVGGLVASVATAVGLSFADERVFRHGVIEAVAFGLAVGVAGVLGDLAESLVKRDALVKDAAKSVPGFGGVLDVIDSVLFAGPVAYWWLAR